MLAIWTMAYHLRVVEHGLRTFDWGELAWSVTVLAVAAIAGRVLSGATLRGLERWGGRSKAAVDHAIVAHVRGPVRWLGPLLGVQLAFDLVTLPKDLIDVVQHALLLLVIGVSAWLAVAMVRVLERVIAGRWDMTAQDNLRARALRTQMRGLGNVLTFVVVVAAVAAMLTTFKRVRALGAGLLASAGVAGVVLGFAGQKSLSTVLAGLQIAITQPIRVDDVVVVEGEWGRIEEITLTYVVVKIWDLRRLVVPVVYFIEKPFQNWTRNAADLIGVVELRLDYSIPLDALRGEFQRVLGESRESGLWDGKTSALQVTDLSERTMLVRLLMSARDASTAFDLRCNVRERLITYVQQHHAGALPRVRGEIEAAR